MRNGSRHCIQWQMLVKDKSVTIDTRNLQYLETETFIVQIGISPSIMTNIFKFCDNATHNPSSGQLLEHRPNKTYYVELTFSNLGAKIWALVPEHFAENYSTVLSATLKSGTQITTLADCVRQNVGFI